MDDHAAKSLRFERGDVKSLPHTDDSQHITLALVDFDAAAQTALFELRNPEARPDEVVGELVRENQLSVEKTNHLRDKMHLPEKPLPLDVSTMATEPVGCKVHEKLLIGDRVWTVATITEAGVTLTPGHDFEAETLVNKIADLEGSSAVTAIAKDLNALD